MKKNNHSVRTVPNSYKINNNNKKRRKKAKLITPTHIYMTAHFHGLEQVVNKMWQG
jgi:hypothetical protein